MVDGLVIDGPHLAPADDVPSAPGPHAALPRIDAEAVEASLLARAVARGAAEVEQALYLREADVTPSAGPKRVSQ